MLSYLRFLRTTALIGIVSGAIFSFVHPSALEARARGFQSGCCSTFCPTDPESICTCGDEQSATCNNAPCYSPPFEFPWQINCEQET